jgi:hypothetical protein
MTLQTSGSISLNNLKSEFGGSGDIKLSDYYRNGSYVPSNITVNTTVREPSSGTNFSDNTYWTVLTGSFTGVRVSWGDNIVHSSDETEHTSASSGGYTYYRGSFVRYDRVPAGPNRYIFRSHYRLHRISGGSSTTPVNRNVPTSGQISLSNFYGGRKT